MQSIQTDALHTCEDHRLYAVRAVYVGQPTVIGMSRGKPVVSGIAKRPVTESSVFVGRTNIAGDGQADRVNHGGPDKAVYAYPAEHLGAWKTERGYSDGPAMFGENISIVGVLEDEARIGDVWRWGDALLQISQPRWPCYKLALHRDDPKLLKAFVASDRCGWYLRVLEHGEAPAGGDIELAERHPAGVTVRDAFRAARKVATPELFQRVRALDVLASTWHTHLDHVWD
jgi:MOSC domain-containing protein YiiM